MLTRRFAVAASLAALFVMVLGCGSSNKPAAGGGGATTKSSDPELNKSMTVEEIAALPPLKQDASKPAGEVPDVSFLVGALSEAPLISDQVKRDLRGKRTIFSGTVLEKSPEDAETLYLVLDGGEFRSQKYKAKCFFAVADGEALKKINPQETVHVEGVTDANVKDLLVEFKECVLKPAVPGAEKNSDEKTPAAKP